MGCEQRTQVKKHTHTTKKKKPPKHTDGLTTV